MYLLRMLRSWKKRGGMRRIIYFVAGNGAGLVTHKRPEPFRPLPTCKLEIDFRLHGSEQEGERIWASSGTQIGSRTRLKPARCSGECGVK